MINVLRNKLQQNHPIHQLFEKLETSKLTDISSKIKEVYDTRHKMCAKISKYFFKFHGSSPLKSLKKCMNASAVERKAKIYKDHLILEFLKSMPDVKVKEYTNGLGKNNSRYLLVIISLTITTVHHKRAYKSS